MTVIISTICPDGFVITSDSRAVDLRTNEVLTNTAKKMFHFGNEIYVGFSGQGLKAVRWFGDGRNYRSVYSALAGGRKGAVNHQAMKRLGGQIRNTSGGITTDLTLNLVWQ